MQSKHIFITQHVYNMLTSTKCIWQSIYMFVELRLQEYTIKCFEDGICWLQADNLVSIYLNGLRFKWSWSLFWPRNWISNHYFPLHVLANILHLERWWATVFESKNNNQERVPVLLPPTVRLVLEAFNRHQLFALSHTWSV